MDVAGILARIIGTAGEALLELQAQDIERHYKAPGELVTRADAVSHGILVRELTWEFPGVALVMEEQENPAAVPATCIVVDELDGTAIFANGMREWGISIAFIKDARPVAGAMRQPVLGITVVSEEGSGTLLDGRKVELGKDCALDDAVIGVEINRFQTPGERGWADSLSKQSLATRCLSTAVGSTIELLSGSTSLYLNARGGKIWDFAAAALAVTEAGGTATDCNGRSLEWTGIPMSVILAGNENLLQKALRLQA